MDNYAEPRGSLILPIYIAQRQASLSTGWQKLFKSILHSDAVATCGLEVRAPLSGEIFDCKCEWSMQKVPQ